jgi:hypothetical protein
LSSGLASIGNHFNYCVDSSINFEFAAVAALSIESIAFATLQRYWRSRFVFLRFIFPPIFLFQHGADFPPVSFHFFAFFPTGATDLRIGVNWRKRLFA